MQGYISNTEKFIYGNKPLLVYWELTRSCDLACKHCRAKAKLGRDKNELTTSEGKRLLSEIKGFEKPYPHVVITGGDPLNRPDLFELIEYGSSIGLPIYVAPSGTQNINKKVITEFKRLGVQGMSLSLDGSNADRHDDFRGVKGCFNDTINAVQFINEKNIPLQINTLVAGETIDDLPAIYELLKNYEINRWSIFFLIQVGRGQALKSISSEEAEAAMNWVYEISKVAPFGIKTTEAPQYRRIALQHLLSEDKSVNILKTPLGRGFGIRDGNGIMFVSHKGEVNPSGFLPAFAGNVKEENIVDIYRYSKVFTEIRDSDNFKGKCGYCEYRLVCGGSRARAYGNSNNYLASDPLCSYQPKKSTNMMNELLQID